MVGMEGRKKMWRSLERIESVSKKRAKKTSQSTKGTTTKANFKLWEGKDIV